MQEEKRIVRRIANVIIAIFLGLLACQFLAIIVEEHVSKNDALTIMIDKNIAYNIYHTGLKNGGQHYDEITIMSPETSDIDVAFNYGIAYASYPDLLKIKAKNHYYSIMEYDNGVFKFYKYSLAHNYYVKILIDREHVYDISYYKYQNVIDYKEIIKDSAIFTGWITLLIGVLWILKMLLKSIDKALNNWVEGDKTDDTNSQNREEDHDDENEDEDEDEDYYYDEDEAEDYYYDDDDDEDVKKKEGQDDQKDSE